MPLTTAQGPTIPFVIVGAEEMINWTLDPALLPLKPATPEVAAPRTPPVFWKLTVPKLPACCVRLARVSTEAPVPVGEALSSVWFRVFAPAPTMTAPTEAASVPCLASNLRVAPARVITLAPAGAITGASPELSRESMPPWRTVKPPPALSVPPSLRANTPPATTIVPAVVLGPVRVSVLVFCLARERDPPKTPPNVVDAVVETVRRAAVALVTVPAMPGKGFTPSNWPTTWLFPLRSSVELPFTRTSVRVAALAVGMTKSVFESPLARMTVPPLITKPPPPVKY